jgi:hypothetical protein
MMRETEALEFDLHTIYVFAQMPDKKSSIFIRENAINDTLDGDSIVNLWYEAMSKIEMEYELSTQQKDFIHCCFLSLLPLFYGDQFDANIVRLTKQFLIDAIFKKIFFEMPRRFGKTMGTSIVAALVLWIIDGIVVGVYSIVKSASDGLVESCLDFYELISGKDKSDCMYDWDKKKGRVRVYNAYGTLSVLWGYSAVSTVRPRIEFFLHIFFSPLHSSVFFGLYWVGLGWVGFEERKRKKKGTSFPSMNKKNPKDIARIRKCSTILLHNADPYQCMAYLRNLPWWLAEKEKTLPSLLEVESIVVHGNKRARILGQGKHPHDFFHPLFHTRLCYSPEA